LTRRKRLQRRKGEGEPKRRKGQETRKKRGERRRESESCPSDSKPRNTFWFKEKKENKGAKAKNDRGFEKMWRRGGGKEILRVGGKVRGQGQKTNRKPVELLR